MLLYMILEEKMLMKNLLQPTRNIVFRSRCILCQSRILSLESSRSSLKTGCRRFSNQPDVSKDAVSYQVGSVFGNLKQNLAKYMAQGLSSKNLYESCADAITYEDFFTACKMPDTFQSWFYVMQLHLWMLLVRLRVEGKAGKRTSYKMVEIMWQDVEQRIKLIGVEDTTERRETMSEYAQQFFGLIVAYDEGLLGHDRQLASALWRNLFYNKHDTDAVALANLVGYVRKQIQHLEQQNTDDILLYGKVRWLPFKENSVKSTTVNGNRDVTGPS